MLKIVFLGTPSLSRTVLDGLIRAGHEIKLVITQPDREKGRGRNVIMSPVKELALDRGIPLFQPERLRSEESISHLSDFLKDDPADLFVVAAFGQILPQAVLDMPRLGCVNVHTSLLPHLRGAAPIQAAILEGLEQTGVTIMQMDAGLDTGPILLQEAVPIEKTESAGSLTDKLAVLGTGLLLKALDALECGRLGPVPQSGESTYAPQIKKEDGLLNFEEDAALLERRVRAFDPWPGTYTFLRGRRLKITAAALPREEVSGEPGEVLSADANGILVACGRGALTLLRLQPEGKKEMDAAAYLRGYPLEKGERLG